MEAVGRNDDVCIMNVCTYIQLLQPLENMRAQDAIDAIKGLQSVDNFKNVLFACFMKKVESICSNGDNIFTIDSDRVQERVDR